MQFRNMKIRNIKIKNMKIQNMKIHNMKTQGIQIKNMKNSNKPPKITKNDKKKILTCKGRGLAVEKKSRARAWIARHWLQTFGFCGFATLRGVFRAKHDTRPGPLHRQSLWVGGERSRINTAVRPYHLPGIRLYG